VGVPAAAGVAFGGDQYVLAERGEMMAANWTAVRRRLAIRRTAHRPPLGARQAGHDSILAPLAATIAATAAVGLGVALAQAERTRRSAKRRRKHERRFRQLPGEPLGEALRRMALGQLDLAIELLGDDRGAGAQPGKRKSAKRGKEHRGKRHGKGGADTLDARAIHDTRKALKRLRALVGLLREELGEQQYKREHKILRDAARRLASVRDAEVMVETLDALIEGGPRKLGRRRPIVELRKRLAAERTAAARRTAADRTTRAQVLDDLRGMRERARWWELPEQPGIAIVEHDLRRVYRQGHRRMRRIERTKGDKRGKGGARPRSGKRSKGGRDQTRATHQWRKRVKDLRYAAEILDLRPLARRADKLGELLGEEHDLALLAEMLPPPGRAPFKDKRGKRARKALLEQIARKRRKLRKRALREGGRLYRRKPKKFTRRVRRVHAHVSHI
jgi:CHAD domain-containing protein